MQPPHICKEKPDSSGKARMLCTISLSDIWVHPNSSALLPCIMKGIVGRPDFSTSLLGVSWLYNGSVIAASGTDGNQTKEGFSLEAGTFAAGNFSVKLHNVSASIQGQYMCIISYNHTVVYSFNVTLSMIVPPSVSISSTVVVIHRPSVIQCQAERFTPPVVDFAWVRSGVAVRPPERVTAVNRTIDGFFWAVSSLKLTPTDQDKDVNFSCVVTHTATEESTIMGFRLNLIYLPTVTLSTLSTLSKSSPVTLSCDIEGFYPDEISVSWLQNGSILPNIPLSQPVPGGSFHTRHFHTLTKENIETGGEVQCLVRHVAVSEPISATMTISATGPKAQDPVMTKSAKASVAVMIISLILVILLCFGFSWRRREEKEKSLIVSGIILPPQIILGKESRVTVSVEGRRVDRVQVIWFLDDTPISDTSQEGPTASVKSPLLPPNGKDGYYKLHTQRPVQPGNAGTPQLVASVTFIPDIAVHKGAVFKCQVSYKGKDRVVAERVSDKLTLLAAPDVSEIKLSEPADHTDTVTLTVQASRFHPALITFRWFCQGGELRPIAPPPSLSAPQPSTQGLFSAVSQCRLPRSELEKSETKIWVTVHHMALKLPIVRETTGFIKIPHVSEIDSPSPAQTSSPEESVTLRCEITGFYPPEISVTWWEDGEREITGGKEVWGPLLTDASTCRVTAILRMGSSEGKVEKKGRYTVCRVMHCSLQEPIEKQWWERHIAPPLIPSSLSVQWEDEFIGVFSLVLSGGYPNASLLWAAGGTVLSPLISTGSEEEGNNGSQQLRSVCTLKKRTGTERRPGAHVHSMGTRERTMDAISDYDPVGVKFMDDIAHMWIKKTKNRPGSPVLKRVTHRGEEGDAKQEEWKKKSNLSHINIVNLGKGERLRVTVEVTHPGLPIPVYLTWIDSQE